MSSPGLPASLRPGSAASLEFEPDKSVVILPIQGGSFFDQFRKSFEYIFFVRSHKMRSSMIAVSSSLLIFLLRNLICEEMNWSLKYIQDSAMSFLPLHGTDFRKVKLHPGSLGN